MKIAIITDSSSGIPNISAVKDLFLVPLMISKEDGSQVADDESFKSDEFYELNDSQILKTSQSVPGMMMSKWDELLKEYDQIVCILLSKGLSGQYNTCKMLSKEDEYNGKVFVADSNGVSTVLRIQVELALKLANEGKTGEEIEKAIEESNDKFSLLIIPKSLDQLVRGGRISKAAAGLAKFLKITPILSYDGKIDKHGKERTFKKAIEESINHLKEFGKNTFIDVSYSRIDAEHLEVVKNLIKDAGFEIRLFDELPNTVICHTGRQTVALATWKK
ncbi:DegV family protein [Spiroplasma monobiae]|uniref:DegV family protein n=1 Tax=Spiroplasma monobiae MQ-1 TaxID=1336748 RepID=A0A2K9LV97_SPISQ|nr:DegV family protein [Spiroplasma monobiae]AUM62950.1 DegV family protein [Spiroplasma monobiae MQ-1]